MTPKGYAARLHRPALGRAPSPSSTSAGLPSGAGNSATPKKASRGLLRDKTRPPGKPPHSTDTVAQVLALACSERLERSPTEPAAPWRRPSGSPCGRSSASGMPIPSSRIASAASSARTIRPSPTRSRTSSASTWIRHARSPRHPDP